MDDSSIDPSLAEVRKWRENLQRELSPLGSSAEIEEIHRRAQGLMKDHDIELRVEPRRSRGEIRG